MIKNMVISSLSYQNIHLKMIVTMTGEPKTYPPPREDFKCSIEKHVMKLPPARQYYKWLGKTGMAVSHPRL